ncbi:hypothetical protein BP6252_03688 [Coleophoma cylindrospora]|uniref:Carboxylesterase type B domain-containing protein n=1 Tax=Coleophoma cylindrospora TaxID=1849047 RepID=A0A3D8S8C3_9HELO|nr:hypothetical protein BP6252_03688 [Coleophoma cylindrospora]
MSLKKIHHAVPSLDSTVIGEHDSAAGLALFRGIPYASLSKRWTHSKVRNSLDSPFDATKFGPRAVQTETATLVESSGVLDPVPIDHEFDCLNLNVTVPTGALDGTDLLPVMVWIHGGAFTHGANSVSRYRPQKLCQLAMSKGTPVILVSANYRLGPLGYAASKDLGAQLLDENEESCNGNYGFVDQRNAFQWVQNHIRDFGGDPSNVTAFGVSAGSASIHFHILSGSPLFDRAILMSGSAPVLGPSPMARYQAAWDALLHKCGLQDEEPMQRLEKLRAMDALELTQKYTSQAMGAVGDGKLLPTTWSMWEENPTTRCKSIIIGDVAVEAIIFDGVTRRISVDGFKRCVTSLLAADEAQIFYERFGFVSKTSQEISEVQYFAALRNLLGVLMFQYPSLMVAEKFPGEVYLYHFEEQSPFPGPTLGLAYHGQCALYTHQNEVDNEVMSEGGKAISREMGRLWTGFAHGQKPWEDWNNGGKFMRFGPSGQHAMVSTKDDELREYEYLKEDWIRKNFDKALNIGSALLSGRYL